MGNILSNWWSDYKFGRNVRLNRAFNFNDSFLQNFDFYSSKPSWIKLNRPEHFEKAVRFNPVVNTAIQLLSTTASNGKKILIDSKSGEEISWTDKRQEVQNAKRLFVDRPNPTQSEKEFTAQGIFYLKTFGNRYVYVNMPVGYENKLDIKFATSLINLPSQYTEVKSTGKYKDQTELNGIVQSYAVNNIDPPDKYNPEVILHFNEPNISGEVPQIMGISKLESLEWPVTNTQLAFEAMNSILRSRGMNGILSPKKTDAMGAMQPLTDDEEKEVKDKFKNQYGLRSDQDQYIISPIGMDYIKTVMNSKELGIYEEFSNNAIIIGNGFGIPPELIKTYIEGATYENQVQSVRRLYQDTVIPMVSDQDSYWTVRFDTENMYGFRIATKWDHIPALSESIKDMSVKLHLDTKTANIGYDNNITTLNEARKLMNLPPVTGGDKYKYQIEGNDG